MSDNIKDAANNRLEELITNVLKIAPADFAKSIGRETYEITRIMDGPRDLPINMAIEIRKKYYESHGVTMDWLYELTDEREVPIDSNERIADILIALGFVFKTKRTRPSRAKYYDENHDKVIDDIWDLYIDRRFHGYVSEIQQLNAIRNRYCTDDEQYKKALEQIKQKYKEILKGIPVGKSKLVDDFSDDLIDSISFADILLESIPNSV